MKVRNIVMQGRKFVEENLFSTTTIALFFLMSFLATAVIDNKMIFFLQILLIIFFVYYFTLFFNTQKETQIDKIRFYEPLKKINTDFIHYIVNSIFPILLLCFLLIVFLLIESFVLKGDIDILMKIEEGENIVENQATLNLIIGGIIFFAYSIFLYSLFILFEVFIYYNNSKEYLQNIKMLLTFFKNNIKNILLITIRMIPWLLISIFTFGMGELYLFPYYVSTCNEFVLDYLGKKENVKILKGESEAIRI